MSHTAPSRALVLAHYGLPMRRQFRVAGLGLPSATFREPDKSFRV